MRVAYIGNFEPPHSTENHVARALEHNGHEVLRLQESLLFTWDAISSETPDVDFILWTRTNFPWDEWGFGSATIDRMQHRMMHLARGKKVPVVGIHLDIWWGLKREEQVLEDPFFMVDLLITADGGHDDRWAEAGVNHVWFPAGVSLAECEPGMFRSDLASPLTFVGNWGGEYHAESQHRFQLVGWLQANFRRDCAFWPRPGEHALRGADLRDLYASVDVAVGDSCFCGTGLPRYWSDRIPETVGRGAYLLHPAVEGMTEQGFDDTTMGVWTAGDWDQLGTKIQWALDNPAERKEIAAAGKAHVMKNHTYEVRMAQLIELLYARKLLKRPAKAKAAK